MSKKKPIIGQLDTGLPSSMVRSTVIPVVSKTGMGVGLNEFSRRLGVSNTQTQRRIKQGTLPEAAFTDENGHRRWTLEQVEGALHQKMTMAKPPKTISVTAMTHHSTLFSKAISFLKADPAATALDLAEYLPADAATTKTILADWADLQGGLFFPKSVIDAIQDIGLEGSWPARTVDAILQNLVESGAALQMGAAPAKKSA